MTSKPKEHVYRADGLKNPFRPPKPYLVQNPSISTQLRTLLNTQIPLKWLLKVVRK